MNQRKIVFLKIAVWLACLFPLGFLVFRGLMDDLGANPIEKATNITGFWTLTFLVASLTITPLRRITKQNWLIRFRRLIGLFAFFYGCLHLTTYIWFDKFFDVADILKDVAKRPFITMGALTFVLLVPLAATSTTWAIRKLGGKRWNALHKLVYLCAVTGVIHFWWRVKSDHTQPAIFATIVAVLFGHRIFVWLAQKVNASRGVAASSAKGFSAPE